jgi:2'-5' RNA ligase
MFVWVGIDVDSQYDEIKAKAMEIDKDMCFRHSCFTLPMHISLKISFEIDKNQYENVVETILSVYKTVESFEIPVKQIENHGNICWIRMQENNKLNELSAKINDILAKEQELYTYLNMNEEAKALVDEIKITKQLPSEESLKQVLNNFFR